MQKYKVIQGDIFGGYSTIKKNLTLQEAIDLEKSLDLDYFTESKILRNDQESYELLNIKGELCKNKN